METRLRRRGDQAPSLRRQLSVLTAASLAVAVAAIAAAAGIGVSSFLRDYVAERLMHDRDTLLAASSVDANGGVSIAQGRMALVYEQPLSGHYYQLTTDDGQVFRSRSLWDAALSVPTLAPGVDRTIEKPGPSGEMLLVAVSGVRNGGRAMTVAVAEDIAPLQRALGRIYWGLTAGGALALVVLLVMLQAALQRGFRPLVRLRREVSRLEAGEITALPEVGVPREVRPLVGETNRLLGLLFQRLTRSRKALGNLAHALKTPLAAIRQMAGEPAISEHPELAGRLRRHVAAMHTMVDNELRRARLAGPAYPASRVPLRETLSDLLDTLRRIYGGRSVEATLEAPADMVFRGDREDLTELFGVVLDNAFKWAAGRVRVRMAPTRSSVVVMVEDDGPGVPEARLGELTARGRRLDESRAGSGLGLSIAEEIAAQYGGGIEFGRSPRLGGLSVRIELPSIDGEIR